MSCISLWQCLPWGKNHPTLAYVLGWIALTWSGFLCMLWCSCLCFNIYQSLLRGHHLNNEARNNFLCYNLKWIYWKLTALREVSWWLGLVANNATLYFKIAEFQPCVHQLRGPSGGRTCSISVKTTASPRKSCSTAAWCGASSPGPPQTQKVQKPQLYGYW